MNLVTNSPLKSAATEPGEEAAEQAEPRLETKKLRLEEEVPVPLRDETPRGHATKDTEGLQPLGSQEEWLTSSRAIRDQEELLPLEA